MERSWWQMANLKLVPFQHLGLGTVVKATVSKKKKRGYSQTKPSLMITAFLQKMTDLYITEVFVLNLRFNAGFHRGCKMSGTFTSFGYSGTNNHAMPCDATSKASGSEIWEGPGSEHLLMTPHRPENLTESPGHQSALLPRNILEIKAVLSSHRFLRDGKLHFQGDLVLQGRH